MNSPPAPSVLAQLKEATAADHVAIEKTINWDRRFSTRAGYTAFLQAWRALYRAAEDELSHQPWTEAGYDFESRRKLRWLESDLAVLGSGAPSPVAAVAVPHPDSLAEAIGACYVLEGATLGGQYISRQLAGLGITPQTGGAFYAGYGAETGPRWNQFRQMAETYCATPERTAAAVAGAKAMFAAMDCCAAVIP